MWSDDSLFVPDFSKNLVSVNSLCNSRHVCCVFDELHAVVVPRNDVFQIGACYCYSQVTKRFVPRHSQLFSRFFYFGNQGRSQEN